MASTSNHTVTPKLVAALRLVTQGEKAACKQLGQRQDLLACLVSISQFSLVPALAIETARLVASIVRHAEDAATLAFCIQQQGCLPLISSLLNSPHPQVSASELQSLAHIFSIVALRHTLLIDIIFFS